MGLDLAAVRDWSYLWPGIDPRIFTPGRVARRWDLSLVGHLYPPLPAPLLDAEMVAGGIGAGPFGAFVEMVERLPLSALPLTPAEAHARLADHCARRGAPLNLGRLDARSMFLFEELLLRLRSRRIVADAMLAASSDTRFFGNAGWALWPDYARHYGGEILTPQDLAEVYRSSTLNVHVTPWPYHFRTFDAMGCGTVVMINRTGRHAVGPVFEQDFTPGEHYVEYGDDDFAEVARRMLRDDEARARIATAAAHRVAASHTWRHRAAQILCDLGFS
jgi:spore maturation protein CgeB